MNVKFMQKIKGNFMAFCSQTSLHGWQYISSTPENEGFWAGFKHIFWSGIVCIAMGWAGTFLYSNTIDFMNSTVVITVDTMTAPLSEVFFPSVVVCNINQVRKSFFAELGIFDNEEFTRQVYHDFILGDAGERLQQDHDDASPKKHLVYWHEQVMKDYLAKHNETLDTKKSMTWFTHQDCKDMFVFSKWNQTKTYDFAIKRDFGTDYGICCWYTPQINFTEIDIHTKENDLQEPDWGEWFMNVSKGSKTGKDNGFTMLFDIESFDYSFYNEGSEGLKLAVVHHLDMPIMRQKGFHIAPGTENQIAVTPTLMTTSKNAMSRLDADQRDCYGEGEISLTFLPKDHGYRYEMSNCLFEAAFENILKTCECAPGFHTMGGVEAMEKFEVCSGEKLTCMNELLNRMGEFDHVNFNGKPRKCRSACEDQVNSLFVTTSSYPNRKTLMYREEFCIMASRLIQKCKTHKRKPLDREYPNLCNLIHDLDDIDFCPNKEWILPKHPNCSSHRCPMVEAILDYAQDNLVMFNIFIKDPYAKRFMKDEKFTKTDYFANSGGLLGLCMGFSLVSAAEIIYHCLIGIFSPFCGYREDKKEREFGDEAPKEEAVGEENYQDSEVWSHYKQPNIDVENEQIGKFIDYETPEMDTFSDISHESSPRNTVCRVTSQHENVPDLKSYPTDNQFLTKYNPNMKARYITKCYSRNTLTPCSIHNETPSPPPYGPYTGLRNTPVTQRHFTSPSGSANESVHLA